MVEWTIYFKRERSLPEKVMGFIGAGGNQQYIERHLRAVVPEARLGGVMIGGSIPGNIIDGLKTGGDTFNNEHYRIVSMFNGVIE